MFCLEKKPEENSGPQNVALIVGVTGIVGNSLAEILPISDTPAAPGRYMALHAAHDPPGMLTTPSNTSNATFPTLNKHKPNFHP
ncbi:UNVERIFIED_CONTAM: (S)-8-oxocitronellyl enol synthase CYC2 [Sesamum calycinum]|uniref:(S)-8-oxocitronellyl enol synthase CYC2 n=1 Tax=Sesamum calycinum TaxID=2727403 RepID=A0AAW2PAX7_9LAMI